MMFFGIFAKSALSKCKIMFVHKDDETTQTGLQRNILYSSLAIDIESFCTFNYQSDVLP